jgi:hypothetical protein
LIQQLSDGTPIDNNDGPYSFNGGIARSREFRHLPSFLTEIAPSHAGIKNLMLTAGQ